MRHKFVALIAIAALLSIITLQEGWYARVVNTGGRGLRMRVAPGLDRPSVKTIPEGAVVKILDGPVDNDGYIWYGVRDPVGDYGWVAGDWLEPVYILFLPLLASSRVGRVP